MAERTEISLRERRCLGRRAGRFQGSGKSRGDTQLSPSTPAAPPSFSDSALLSVCGWTLITKQELIPLEIGGFSPSAPMRKTHRTHSGRLAWSMSRTGPMPDPTSEWGHRSARPVHVCGPRGGPRGWSFTQDSNHASSNLAVTLKMPGPPGMTWCFHCFIAGMET